MGKRHRMEKNQAASPSILRPVLALVLVFGITAAALFLYKHGTLVQTLDQIEYSGWIGYSTFIAFFAISSLPIIFLWFVFCIAAGFFFGIYWAMFLTITGSSIGSYLLFLGARYQCSSFIRIKLKDSPLIARVDKLISLHPYRYGFSFRITPIPIGLCTTVLSVRKIIFFFILFKITKIIFQKYN